MPIRASSTALAAIATALCMACAMASPGASAPSRPLVRPFIVTATSQAAARALAQAERRRGVRVTRQFTHVLAGFTARLNQTEVRRLRRTGSVRGVDLDRLVNTTPIERRTSTTGLWGLDRIDQRGLPLDGQIVTAGQGQGVTVYVLDTGIRLDQVQFQGRLGTGHDVVSSPNGNGDCNGHGTWVAGVIGGEITGVAPQVTLVPIRMMGCGGVGYASDLIAGLDWMVQDHQQGVPAVANISIYGPRMDPVNTAVASAVADGVVVSAAAGNDGNNACDGSPASSPDAITTAAMSPGDAMEVWSGWGTCVDLLAPGEAITTTEAAPVGLATVGGTSIAAAFTSGAAAIDLGLSPFLMPSDVVGLLQASATPNVISGLLPGTPNRLLYVGTPADPSAQQASVAPAGTYVLRQISVSFRRAAHTRAPLGRYTVNGRTREASQITLTVAGRSVDRRHVPANAFSYRTRITNRISVVRLVVRPVNRAFSTSSVRVRVRFPR